MKTRVEAVLIGPPAAGKGSFAKLLSKELGFSVLSPGDIYKELRDHDTETGNIVKESLKDGGICPNWLTNRIVNEEASKLVSLGVKGLILDGYPRSQEQLDFMSESMEVGAYIHIDAPYALLASAAANRRFCAVCGSVLSALKASTYCRHVVDAFESAHSNTLFSCDDILVTRWDDNHDMHQKRLANYYHLTQPIISQVDRLCNYGRFDLMSNPGLDQVALHWLKLKLGLV